MTQANKNVQVELPAPESGHHMDFGDTQYNDMELYIGRGRALADMLQVALQGGGMEPESLERCISMLYEKLTRLENIWQEAAARRGID